MLHNHLTITMEANAAQRERIIKALEEPTVIVQPVWYIPVTLTYEGGPSITCKELDMFQIKVDEKVQIAFGKPRDHFQNEAKYESPEIINNNPEQFQFVAFDGNPWAGWLRVVDKTLEADPLQNCGTFTVRVDKKIGDGVDTIEKIIGVERIAGDAETFGEIAAGSSEPDRDPPVEPPVVTDPPVEPPVEPPVVEDPPVEPPVEPPVVEDPPVVVEPPVVEPPVVEPPVVEEPPVVVEPPVSGETPPIVEPEAPAEPV